MKLPRGFLVLCALIFFGACVGFLLSKLQVGNEVQGPVRSEVSSEEVVIHFPEAFPEEMPEAWGVEFPAGAIPGEMVMHFISRKDYMAYLKMLSEAGLSPIGQIDELLVVRVGKDAMSGPNPGLYGGQGSFSYRVERPLPPVDVDPEQYAKLRALGVSARSVVGGQVEGDGSGVLVGILDSGIEAHPQFDDVYIVHIDLAGGGVAGPGATHGTAVASIIAGSEGIAPEAELFVVRVLDDEGLGNSFHVAQGIVQAVDLGVDVLNMSLGVYQDTQVLREAVRYAEANNVIMVAAAGNDGYTRMPYPAAYPQVLSVTAVDGLGRQALFPNQSDTIDFAAPGVGVLTAKEDEGTMLFSGTSAAAPFVTGTLASILSADASRSPQEAVDLMKRYLDEAGAPGADPVYGAGVVNWDRLRERGTAAILDVALAEIYLPANAQPGTTMPVEVIVQNRGTSWLTTSTLSVIVGESDPVDFTIGTLGPGQITTRTVYTQVPSIDSGDSLDIAAQVLPEEPLDDVRFDNNTKAVFFKPVQRQ
jgi:subtilisin family serine protease